MGLTWRMTTRWQLATAMDRTDVPGRWAAQVAPGFSIGAKTNGGYLLALAAKAAVREAEQAGAHADPLSVTGTFVASPPPGPVTAHVTTLRTGRSSSAMTVSVESGGTVYLHASITVGTLPPSDAEPVHDSVPAPVMPPLDRCFLLPSSGLGYPVAILDELRQHADPATIGWARGKPSGAGEIRAWVSFVDEQEWDPVSLVMAVDALPPATFDLGHPGWAPTLSLTALVRAVPAPGALLVRQVARLLSAGEASSSGARTATVDETCDAWDSTGRLVATGHQLATLRLAV